MGGYKGWQGVTRGHTETCFLIRTSTDSFSLSILHENQGWRNVKFLTKTIYLTPLEKFLFCDFHKKIFFQSLNTFFLSKTSANTFFDLFLINTIHEKPSIVFLPKSCTIPFGKILRFLKSMFLLSRKASFLTRTSPNSLSRGIFIKRNVNKISNFWPTPWTNPLKKFSFCGFLKSMSS